MKPDWSMAPSWAKFLAMDEDGEWYWYQDRPILRDHGVWARASGEVRLAGEPSLEGWRDTLESRP